MVRWTWWSFDP